jgi:AhpD family alkylhydroperoxidase
MCCGEGPEEKVRCLGERMGGYVPETLKAIEEYNPDLVELIERLDKVLLEDGALDKKTKRLIALACVAMRMCEDCIYPQAKVAMNYGATKKEILETMEICIITGGVPTFSVAKKGIGKLFKEMDK